MEWISGFRPGYSFLKCSGFLLVALGMSVQCTAQLFSEISINGEIQSLDKRWDLVDTVGGQTFRLDPYQPIYILLGRWSSSPNKQPVGQSPEYSLSEPLDLDVVESKFQISLKTKIAQGIFNNKGDLWVGYTQLAAWQVYNKPFSRPFRELNYEPEIIFNYPLDFKMLGFQAKMAGLAFNHESNGRSLPLSRSWNRVIFHFAMEKEGWQIIFRPWYVIKGNDEDNPDADDYIGRAELTVIHAFGSHMIYAVGRHPFNYLARGSLELNWIFPIKGNLRGHIQYFAGYGETLIDYRHYQNTFGIGISLIDW
jgi:phospholipase A1